MVDIKNIPIIMTTKVVKRMAHPHIIVQLMETGLSEYEARVYSGLLESSPLTGYEIAKKTGVPGSKVYEILRKLIVKGMVCELNENGKTRYIPQEGRDFILSARRKMAETLGSLEKSFDGLASEQNSSYIWTYDSRPDSIKKIQTMLDGACASFLLSVWEEDFALLADPVACAAERGCRVAMIMFGDPGNTSTGSGVSCFYHPIRDTLYNEKGGRCLVAVADSCEAFMGTLYSGDIAEGAWSRNPGFATLAEDYIKHDIYIMKIVRRFDSILKANYGPGYELLRDIFDDTTLMKENE